MPTTKDQRDIIVDTTEAGVTVGTLTVGFSAALTSEFGGQLGFQDLGAGGLARDRTKHELTLLRADGTKYADITIRLVARVNPQAGFSGSAAVRSARSTFDPAPRSNRVQLNREVAAGFSRSWRQRMLDGGGEVRFVHVAKLDVGLELVDPRANAVTQTVTTQRDDTISIAYAVLEGGRPIANGTVTMTAKSATSGGYSCGPIIVDDDDD